MPNTAQPVLSTIHSRANLNSHVRGVEKGTLSIAVCRLLKCLLKHMLPLVLVHGLSHVTRWKKDLRIRKIEITAVMY